LPSLSSRRLLAVMAAVAVLLTPFLSRPLLADGGTPDQLYSEISAAFGRVSVVQGEGGNVTGVVRLLNQALALVEEGASVQGSDAAQAQTYYQQAEDVVRSVNAQLPSVEQQGLASSRSQLAWLAATMIVLALAGALVFRFGGRAFWALWVRTHHDWVVRKA